MIKMRSNLLPILISICFLGVISAYTINGDSARPIQIGHTVDNKFQFELDELKNILEADYIRDRQVVIVSVAGTIRKGKSFLLNFFLRFLYARYEKHDVSDWIGENNNTELRGFLWRGGRKPATTGILMWSEIFTHDYENGDKVAIILLDTQGTFDSRSTLLELKTVFALSTLLSSVQCFNVMQNIQEGDLQDLQLFGEYARLALEQSGVKPFQNLIFIVRDWQNELEVDYGWNGQQLLHEVLAENPSYQTVDMRQLRKDILSSFANISAFLMPHPGRIVANGKFTGQVSEIDSDFKTYLQELVPSVFAPENLVVKEINGQKVRAHEFVQYIEQYTKLFDGETLPEPKTVLRATAEVNNMILYNNSLYEYVNSMEKYFTNEDVYYNQTEMKKIHLDARETAIEQFQSKRKLGSNELISSFERRLSDEIDLKFQDYEAINKKIRLAFIDEARFHNEKCVYEIYQKIKQQMVEEANGISDYNLTIIFTEKKVAALREFDALKRGDDTFSNSYKGRLEQYLEIFLPILNQINKAERVKRATAEVDNMILYNNSLYEYVNSMEKYFTNEDVYYNETEMKKIHLDARETAIEQFQSKRKLGSNELISSFERRLSDEIDLKFQDYEAINKKIRLAFIDEARFHNEKCVYEIYQKIKQQMVEEANGISDYNLTNLFTEKKVAALREFDALKRGDDTFSNSYKDRLEQYLEIFLPILNQINKAERVKNNRMPYPGRIVANGQFTGEVSEIDSDFKTYPQELVPSVFAPENLVVKEINGQKVPSHEFVQYIEQYTKLFDGETLPEPKTVLQATAEVDNMILYNNSLYEYVNSMEKYFTNEDVYYNETEMKKIHLDARETAIEQFQSKRKLGSNELISSFERRLNDEIDLKFQDYEAINKKIRLAFIDEARFHNEKRVYEIYQKIKQQMVEEANGISDYNLTNLFTEKKVAALREFDALKRGDDTFSNSYKDRLEQNLEFFLPILNRINKSERVKNDYNRMLEENRINKTQRDNNDYNRMLEEKIESKKSNNILKTVAKTGAGATVGAGIGAMLGGPPGAVIGLLLGGLFGYIV